MRHVTRPHLDGHDGAVETLEVLCRLPGEIGLLLILAGGDGDPSPSTGGGIESHGVDKVEHSPMLQIIAINKEEVGGYVVQLE